VTLEGTLGDKKRTFEYVVNFPEKTGKDLELVETIWARRKIGFLLDQVRTNGENKEVVEAIITLSKKYGIATPYTSYLIVPDEPLPVVGFGQPAPNTPPPKPPSGVNGKGIPGGTSGSSGGKTQSRLPPALPVPSVNTFVPFQYAPGWGTSGGMIGFGGGISGGMGMGGGIMGGVGGPYAGTGLKGPAGPALPKMTVADWARLSAKGKGGTGSAKSGQFEANRPGDAASPKAKAVKEAYDQARIALTTGQYTQTQIGRLGVDLSVQSNSLRQETRQTLSAQRKVAGRTLIEIGGAWIDTGFKAEMKSLSIKAFSPAYFCLLKQRPELREVFQLGNALVWVAPSGTALVIDPSAGEENLKEPAIDELFKKGAKKHTGNK
jgi:Ca-activated chloride channel family protein